MRGLYDTETKGELLSKVEKFSLDDTVCFCGGQGDRQALIGGT